MPLLPSLLLTLASASAVSAHSWVSNINIDGKAYKGFNPVPGLPNDDVLAAWSTTATDQGYVNQTDYAHPDIICHRGAANGKGHAPVQAGGEIHIQWNGWPQNHKGPVMDYLAPCGESCASVDKTRLEFYKISQAGLVTPDIQAPLGLWASDQLIANNNSWVVAIPPDTMPGFYVLRTEIIALHNASYGDGAQNYPSCFNLEILGNGTKHQSGTLGEKLYKASEPGVQLNITTGVTHYDIPGPTLIPDATTAPLEHPVPTGSGTPVTGDEITVIATPNPPAPVRNATRLHARDIERRWFHQGQGF